MLSRGIKNMLKTENKFTGTYYTCMKRSAALLQI